jgi:predicted ABC-class ATPase
VANKRHLFFTENASGSTSQAANLVEAVALGSRLLLVDEDISAVNFLVNDERMQEIIGRENEPITPLSQRIRDLADKQGLSFILVIGASGDYLDLADRLVVMREYQALDFSDKLKPLSGKEETKNISAAAIISESVLPQDLLWKKWQDTARAAGGKKVKLQARADKSIHIGKLSAEVDRLDGVDNTDYVRGLAHMVWSLVRMEKPAGLPERIQKLQKKIKEEGVDALEDSFSVSYTMPRLLDAARAVLRIRL